MTTLAAPQTRLWTVQEYHQMAYPAVFGPDERLELINGVIVFRSTDIPRPFTCTEIDRLQMMGLLSSVDDVPCTGEGKSISMRPMGPPHATAIGKTGIALSSVFQDGYVIKDQVPSSLSGITEPEPDLLVAVGTYDDYADRHPDLSKSVLVVEVSESSLKQDRTTKADLYAQAGVQDYWIVNLNDRTLEIRRKPQNGQYQEVAIYKEHEAVAPLAAPHASIPVARLLPMARKTEGS